MTCLPHLSLKGELSHREGTLLLLLTESLLGSLHLQKYSNFYLLLRQSTTHGTSRLRAQIRREVLGLSVVLLQLQISNGNRSYGSSLLLAEHSQSTSNILAHHLNLGEFRGSSSSHLSHTELRQIIQLNTTWESSFL